MFSFFGNKKDELSGIQQEDIKVKLKTGYELEGNVVARIIYCLEQIQKSDPMGFVYLLEKCRNPDYKLMPYTIEVLKNWDFLENDKVPEEVKNVFLSATIDQNEKNFFKISLTDPIDHVPTIKRSLN